MTRLSDIIDVTVFNDLPGYNSPERTRFFESGAVQRNELLDQLAGQPGSVAELPFWKDIDPDEDPNLSNDDPDDKASPKRIEQGRQVAYKAHLNQGWSEMDLAAELAMGGRAMERIRSRVDVYWTRQWQRRLIRAALGVMADSKDNHDEDMIEEISDVFSKSAFVRAAGTMGDRRDELSALAVHSSVRDQMEFNDQIDYIRDSEGNLIGESFSGFTLIVDDGLPAEENTDGDMEYTSILFGNGAFGWGASEAIEPTEVYRDPRAGKGGGQEELWSRRTWLLHPFGYQASSPSDQSHSLSELEDGSTWERVIDRKAIPLAFLKTVGDGEG
ncbi:MAG: hypothetical protein ACOC1T_03960 [Halorhodospira sp.]